MDRAKWRSQYGEHMIYTVIEGRIIFASSLSWGAPPASGSKHDFSDRQGNETAWKKLLRLDMRSDARLQAAAMW